MKRYSADITISNQDDLMNLLGPKNKYLELYEENFSVSIDHRGDTLTVEASDKEKVDQVIDLFQSLKEVMEDYGKLEMMDIMTAIKMTQAGQLDFFPNLFTKIIGRTYEGLGIRPKTYGQYQYVQAIQNKPVVFGVGMAGTGKTFIAVAMAVEAMRRGEVKKIIITRPAVEAGENLGFLPGDLKEKVDPYLRPIYDALYLIYGTEQTNRMMERGTIEVAPLAYMRGRTLDNAFVILDEAQNTTIAQMKMFLTRLGFGSKMVVNGDPTQVDLPRGVTSGLVDASRRLTNINAINFVEFEASDVVRHPVVAEIIKAYDESDKRE